MSIVFDYLWKHDNHTGTLMSFDVNVHRHTGSSHREDKSSHREDKYIVMVRDTIWRKI